ELALVVAAEGAENGAPFDRHAAVLEGLERHALLDQGVGDGLADVLPGEGVRRGDPHAAVDVEGTTQRPLQALLVEPQGAVFEARLAMDRLRHFLGVGHGRHALRIHVGHAGDVLEPGLGKRLDEADLVRDRDHLLLRLEALARPSSEMVTRLGRSDIVSCSYGSATQPSSSWKASSRAFLMLGRAISTSRIAVAISRPRLIGLCRNTIGSPRDSSMARRKYSSICGPSTRPSRKGAPSQPSREKT